MEKPDSQITEATIVEETKTIPDSRKSKEVCEIQMPSSSTDVVTPTTEITVMEKGEATSTAPVVMGTPETMIVEEVNFSPPTRKLKSPKDSQELSPKEKTQTAVKPDSQITEATIEEETKSRKSKEDADSRKPYSTTDVVIGPTDITVVEKGKMSPTTSKPKGPKRLPDVATKDVAEITKEPEIQIGLEHTKTVLLKQTKVIQTPTMSKSSDDTTAVKPGSFAVGTTDVEPEPEKGAVEMTEAPHLQETILTATNVVSKSSEDPTAVKPGSVIVGTTDVEPQEAGKEFEIEKAASTAEIVMRAPETSPKISQELSPKEETQTKDDPDSQITEATVVEETKIKPKRRKSREDPVSLKPSSTTSVVARKSKSPKVSQELSPKEETQTMEKPDSQITEAPIVEETKSRNLKEDPVSKKPYSTADVVIGPTDITVVEKGNMSTSTSKPKGPKHLPDVATKDVAEITKL